MTFPITEQQLIPVVERSIPEGHEDDRAFVMSIWRQFVPLLNEAYARGRRAAMHKEESHV